MIKNIVFVLLAILLILSQISFFDNFLLFRQYFNLVLIVVVFFTVIINFKYGIYFAIISGLILDLYSPYNYGLISVSMIIPVILISFLFKKLLARRSLFSLALVMIISTFVYHLCLSLLTNLFFWFGRNNMAISLNADYLYTVLIQIAVNTIFIFLLFIFVKFINEKIKSKFLISEHI